MCHGEGVKYALGLILAAVIAPTHSPADAAPTPTALPVTVPADAVAAFGPLEVRVRKLHLVRPDLQRFPIPYDTVC